MAAPPHYKVIFSGVVGDPSAPAEIWSFGLALGGNPEADLTKAQMLTMANNCSSAFGNLTAGIQSNTVLTRIRVVRIRNDGLYARDTDGSYMKADLLSPTQAGTQAVAVPPQVALAISLRSTFPGPLGRGRFYLPGPLVGTLDSSGRLSTTVRTGHLNRAVTFLNAVNTSSLALNPALRVSIASAGSASQGIPAGMRNVTSVAVGRVLDTQRRRRNDLLEEHAAAALT